MKHLLLNLLLVSLALTCVPARSEEASSSAAHADQHTTVQPGPLESERKTLLTKIHEVRSLGIGTQSYLTAFQDLENMVKKGTSQETIQKRLKSINAALDEQVSLLKPKTSANIRTLKDFTPEKLISLEKARLYMVSRVNADRAKHNLSPLTLDSIATMAGQIHSDEMAVIGYLSHWDISGKKPWQRYTEAGGTQNIGENLCYLGKLENINGNSPGNFELPKNQLFSADDLVQMQSAFMNEKPPNDGHRVQILRPEHNSIGIGLSYATNPEGEHRVFLNEEFVDHYGEYSKLPSKIVRGKAFEVSGILCTKVRLHAVSILQEPQPKPMTKEELDKLPRHCSLPDKSIVDYFPESKNAVGATVKVWTKDDGQHFSVWITPGEDWKSGLYYVQIWATLTNNTKPVIVSCRTILLDSDCSF